MIAAALAVFALGVLVGRLARALPEPPLREAPRPAEACVEQWLPINEEDEALVDRVVTKAQANETRRPLWTAEDVAQFPERRARAYAETDWIGADDP